MSRPHKQQGSPSVPQTARPNVSLARRGKDRFLHGNGWPVLALMAVALAAYSNSFQAGMVFDNGQAILQDSRVHALTSENIHLILNQEYWYRSSTTGLYRPLTPFSYLLNYTVLGNGPH